MTLDETEELARAIVNTCASPGAAILFGSSAARPASRSFSSKRWSVELDFTLNDFFAQVSMLKRLVALLTSHVRARAMLDAASDTDSPPLWLLSSSRFAAEWIRWVGADDGLRACSSWANDIAVWPQLPMQVEVATTRCNHHMALAATLYTGELTGVLAFSGDPLCHFSWSQEPKIRIYVAALPETVVILLLQAKTEGANRTLRPSEIVSHPFFHVYHPLVTDIANGSGTLVVWIQDIATTLQPVPTAAMRILPPDVNHALPWGPTPSELERLRNLNPTNFQSNSDR